MPACVWTHVRVDARAHGLTTSFTASYFENRKGNFRNVCCLLSADVS